MERRAAGKDTPSLILITNTFSVKIKQNSVQKLNFPKTKLVKIIDIQL